LPYLGILPPGKVDSFSERLPYSVAGILTVGIFTLLIKKITHDNKLAIFSGLMLAIMPWHIEQSRVISEPMLGLLAILLLVILPQYFKQFWVSFFGILISGTIFYWVYPHFWIFTGNWGLPTIRECLNNLYKLIFIEFLFYKNDSFWLGGLRTYGTMLPSVLFLFLIGLYKISFINYKKLLKWTSIFMIIWVISAISPFFPESREYFLVTPFLALILGLGLKEIFLGLTKAKILIKIILFVYLLFIIYDYTLFFHFYINHYPQRINSELKYEEIKF